MISYGPLIDRTRQAWKLYVANTGIVLSLVIHAVARWFVRGISGRELAAYSGASALLAAASLVIFFGTVRCPACGANWVLRAFKHQPVRWLEWLHAQQACPVCGSNGQLPPPARR